MEFFLLVIAFLLILIGAVGSVLPVLPGPPLAYCGLLILHFSGKDFRLPLWILLVTGVLTLTITILDYVMPAYGTKYFGGSKYGSWGSTIGLIVGVFSSWLGPWGILIGPFLGALIGELIYGQSTGKAFQAALGSFLGFLGGTFMKIMFCFTLLVIYLFYLLRGLW